MIRAFLFDFGQTLVDSSEGFKSAEKEAQRAIFQRLKRTPSRPSREGFLAAYRKVRTEYHQQSCFSRPAIWQEVYRRFKCEPDANRLRRWEEQYWHRVSALTRPFEEAVPVLESLSKQYRLAVITNTQGQKGGDSHRMALFPRLEKFFQVIVVAGEFGIPPKPDPKPFWSCLAALKVPPHEAVMVGDDWRIDIGGARRVGIQPVWLQHHSVPRNWPAVDTTVPVITRLDQLLALSFS